MELNEKLQLVFDSMNLRGQAILSIGDVEVEIDVNELAAIISSVKAQDIHLETLETLLFQTFDKAEEKQ